MVPFLKQTASHYFALGEMDKLCFILPNKRSCAFLRKYFAESAAESGKPLLSAEITTMNEFFFNLDSLRKADRVQQLLLLYDCYKELNPACESLDDFIFWGDVLLADFDDVDKYLVKAQALFANVADFRSIQDSMEYLDESQEAAIRHFISHFREGGRYKDEFKKIWNILYPLYCRFNETLGSRGLCYEGMAYRDLAQRLDGEPVVDMLAAAGRDACKYVFVGMNALNGCERKLMRKMRDAGIAEFCWDYSSEWIKNSDNKSSFFLADNVLEFPQAFIPDSGEVLPKPEIKVLGVPSAVGQAKQLPKIFEEMGAHGLETAVVLPDESMLMTVLNSIPEEIGELNVTMGYPMAASSFRALMSDVSALQMHIRVREDECYFYQKQVWSILSNSILKSVLGPETVAALDLIKAESRYYIAASRLCVDELCACIFRPVVTDTSRNDADGSEEIALYLQKLISLVASRMLEHNELSVELSFAKEYYLAVGKLRNFRLPVRPATYFRLLDKLVGGISVPFKGEPLQGLQIMGPLETRALDFDNIVILNCNEGFFPRRNVSASFIPGELRRGFEMPTYEYQDAVWAYYFYRMIQRCSRLWLLYDTRTEGLRNGEESRYIKQLELHFEAPLTRCRLNSPLKIHEAPPEIAKTAEDLEILLNSTLSASALQAYLRCPAQFYYQSVKKLSKADEASDSLDMGMLGNVFHKLMQTLYRRPGGRVDADYLAGLLDRDSSHLVVPSVVELAEKFIMEELGCFEVGGKNLISRDLLCRYVYISIKRDLEMMRSLELDEIRVLGLEKKVEADIDGFHFKGYIDRLDSLTPDAIRIVDYKTGKVEDNDFVITEANAGSVVEALFAPDNKDRPKIALQLYLYDRMVSLNGLDKGRTIYNSIYQPLRLHCNPVENIVLNQEFKEAMDLRLTDLLNELRDPGIGFRRTSLETECSYCNFKTLCGR